jgi:hypothetical protein
MATHLPYIVVVFFGIEKGNCGHSCKLHGMWQCGGGGNLGMVQVMVEGKEEMAIASI